MRIPLKKKPAHVNRHCDLEGTAGISKLCINWHLCIIRLYIKIILVRICYASGFLIHKYTSRAFETMVHLEIYCYAYGEYCIIRHRCLFNKAVFSISKDGDNSKIIKVSNIPYRMSPYLCIFTGQAWGSLHFIKSDFNFERKTDSALALYIQFTVASPS